MFCIYICLNVQYLKFIRIVICVVIRNTAFIIKAESCGHRRKKKSSAIYWFFFFFILCFVLNIYSFFSVTRTSVYLMASDMHVTVFFFIEVELIYKVMLISAV